MGRVRAAGFRQRNLREAAGQHRRPAQGDRDFVFQGSGCRLGETGNPDRPQGRWQGSVWTVGYSNQHCGKAIANRTIAIEGLRLLRLEPMRQRALVLISVVTVMAGAVVPSAQVTSKFRAEHDRLMYAARDFAIKKGL